MAVSHHVGVLFQFLVTNVDDGQEETQVLDMIQTMFNNDAQNITKAAALKTPVLSNWLDVHCRQSQYSLQVCFGLVQWE